MEAKNAQCQPNVQEMLEMFQKLGTDDQKLFLETLQERSMSISEKAKKENFWSVNQHNVGHSSSKPKPEKNNSFLTYQKRSGCISEGDDFEILMCGLYALKLSTNDEVVDFAMTSNEDGCGVFDDIKLDVTFKNGTQRVFLLQLKHKKDNKKSIGNQQLFGKEGPFFLPKYFKSQTEIAKKDAVYIIYTNCSINVQEDAASNEFIVEKCNDMEYRDIISNSQESNLDSIFRCKSSKTNQIIYLLGRQKNVGKTQSDIKDILQKWLKPELYDSFFHFMKEWWSGKFILNKYDFIAKLAELAFSPFLKTISGTKHNEKTIHLNQAIMKFQFTIVKNNDNIVENIWPNKERFEEREYKKTAHKFGLDLKDSSTHSKTLWYMSKVPLIVKVKESNKEAIKGIMKLLQGTCEDKRVVLVGNVTKAELFHGKIFENLTDLRESEDETYFLEILENLKVSLQGRDSISIKQLFEVDKKFLNILEVEHLLKMSQKDLIVGDPFKFPSENHIRRNITPHCIHSKDILKCYEENKNDSLVIINCDNFQKQWDTNLDINIEELSDYLTKNSEKEKLILLSTKRKCTIVDFEKVCKKSKKSNVCLFQKFEDEFYVLLLCKGSPLKPDENFLIDETKVHKYFNSPFNAFCAPPGMGKTTLMKILSKETPSESWGVYINLIKHNSFLTQKPSNETQLNHFLDSKEDTLVTQFKNIFRKKQKIYIYLDGLDEVHSNNVNVVINFIKYLSHEGINVWVSSRENLRQKLSEDLNAVPIDIQELNEDQQQNYITKRLEIKFNLKEIKKIVRVIFESSGINNSRQMLGLPLQLHIITEIFLTNEEVYENLEQKNFFVLTQLYKLYFDGKKKSEFKKLELDEQIEYQLRINYDTILEEYEIPALQTCLDDEDYIKLEPNENKKDTFLEIIKNEGDKYGIILSVEKTCGVIFLHQTYAEYFACLWLKKNLNKARVLRDRIFLERYENLRLMFDVMLGEDNPLHLAIIYKNIKQFEEHIQDVDRKDLGGRTPLCLACAYGTKYPENGRKKESLPFFSGLNRENNFYETMIKILLQKDVNLKEDELFGFSYIEYSLKAKCLYSFEKMLETKLFNFEEYQTIVFNLYEPKVLARYCAQFGYFNIFQELITCRPELITKLGDFSELLKYAITGTRDDSHLVPRFGNMEVIVTLITIQDTDINQVFIDDTYSFSEEYHNALDFACRFRYFDVLETLLENGLRCSDGNTILHVTAYYGTLNKEVINLYHKLTKINGTSDVNALNLYRRTALHLACEKGHVEIVKKLTEIGADVNIPDFDKAFYCRSKSENNREILNILIDAGLDVNSRYDGRTVLQVACENGYEEIVKKLIEKGSDVNIFDGSKTFYYVTQKNPEILTMLINAGLDVNARNDNGQTALHLACKEGYLEVVKKLIESGIDVNLLDNDKNNAFHYAYKNNVDKAVLTMLIEAGLNVNARNKHGQAAIHLACQNADDDLTMNLIESVNINILDYQNNTILHYASKCKFVNTTIIHKVINCGVNVNSKNIHGETPLHLACEVGVIDNVSQLINCGANITNVTILNRSYLHYASISGNCAIIRLILKESEINSRDVYGASALHVACKFGCVEAIKELVVNEADVNAVDNKNMTSLHYTTLAKENHEGMITYLVEHGIDVEANDSKGRNALNYAIQIESYSAVRAFIENNIFWDSFNTRNVMFLYCSVYSGSDSGVAFFLQNETIAQVDIYSEEFPLYFASKKGQLDPEIVLNMTIFIQKLIEESRCWDEKYTRYGIIEYLRFQSTKYSNVDFLQIFRQATLVRWTDSYHWETRCNDIKRFLKEYNVQQKLSSNKMSLDTDDDF